nr:MAG TPA: hypothetical protein [Caudoviricetes sp.]
MKNITIKDNDKRYKTPIRYPYAICSIRVDAH